MSVRSVLGLWFNRGNEVTHRYRGQVNTRACVIVHKVYEALLRPRLVVLLLASIESYYRGIIP